MILCGYFWGVSPETLYQWYYGRVVGGKKVVEEKKEEKKGEKKGEMMEEKMEEDE